MISVSSLSMSYGDALLFKEVCFTLNAHERCGLIGRNGTGKTTLLRLLLGKEHPDSGKILMPKGYRLGALDQHIRFLQPTVLEEALLGLKEEEREDVYKAERILFGLGFGKDELSLPPSKLSGGFHLRLHLAKVLLSDPDCLLLDEPTNYLDILSLRFLSQFLRGWKKELIMVSHDREFLDSVTTHTLGICRNKVKKIGGGTIDFFNAVLLEEETFEKTRANLEKKRSHMQLFVDRLGAKASKASQAQSRKKMIEKIPVLEELKELEDLALSFQEKPFFGKKMGEVSDLSFCYDGAKKDPSSPFLINSLSFSIDPHDRIAIIGRNGYGKSTLLRLLSQELVPIQGSVLYSPNTAIGYFGQTNIDRHNESLTIEEEIAAANPALPFQEVKGICGKMMFQGKLSEKKIAVLSGGERSRVLLGKILSVPCNLLLLDEPTHHLDIESIEALIDALEDFQGALAIVTHSELILERLRLHKMIICHADKQELFLGGYPEFLEKRGWSEEKEIPKEKEGESLWKEEKRKRADLVRERSRILKPLRDEMNHLENSITHFEKEKEGMNRKLIEAAQNNEVEVIQNLLKELGKIEKELQNLYDTLMKIDEKLTQESARISNTSY